MMNAGKFLIVSIKSSYFFLKEPRYLAGVFIKFFTYFYLSDCTIEKNNLKKTVKIKWLFNFYSIDNSQNLLSIALNNKTTSNIEEIYLKIYTELVLKDRKLISKKQLDFKNY